MLCQLLVISILHISNTIVAYNILVYNSKYSHSHSNFMGGIADILVDAGHNVTSLIPVMDGSIADGTMRSAIIRVEASGKTTEIVKEMHSSHGDLFAAPIFDLSVAFVSSRVFGELFSVQCEAVIEEKGLIEKIRESEFEVFITENFDMCGMGLSHLTSPKSTIMVSSTLLLPYQQDDTGVPQMLSFVPASLTSHLNVHSIWSRASNLVAEFLDRRFFKDGREMVHEVFRKHFGSDFPSFSELTSHSAFVLTNTEPLLDFAHPTLHKVIPIGGLGARPPKSLDEYWSEVLSRRQRTILISLGSIVLSKNMPSNVRRSILQTVARFSDATFIWKYEDLEDDFAKKEAANLENLVLSKWIPQNDLLNDPRLALFISHGGMGSMQETAMRGVPGLFIPIFADQPRNAAMMQHNGLGLVFDKFDLADAEKLTAAVTELLDNPKYRERSTRLSKMLAKKPYQARELLVKHVQFAAEFGPSSSLRPQSLDMTFIEYHNLDIIFVVFLILLIPIYFMAKRLYKSFGRCRKTEEKEKKS